MTTQHTPGPWILANSDAYNTVVIAQGAEICTVIEHQGGDRKANSRLIAAAPELLAALKALLSDAEDVGFEGISVEAFDSIHAARAALAKAEGR